MRDSTTSPWVTRLIIGLALLLRFAYALHTGALRHPQTWEQEQIATNLVERHEFLFVSDGGTYRSYAEPLYPFLAAVVYLLTGHSRAALVVVQILISTATVGLTGRTARKVTRDAIGGHVAALITATHPGLIHYASVIHPLVLDAFFFALCGMLLVESMQSNRLRTQVAAGAAIGLGALTRPTILLFLIPLCWTAVSGRRTLAVCVAACAFVLPWTLRNAAIHHVFMLTRSGTGFVFWLGNNPQSSGSAMTDDGRAVLTLAPPALLQEARAAGEAEGDRIFARAAWTYIRADPAGAVERFVRRLGDFWWFSARWGRQFSPRARLVYRVWWAAILLLVIVGAYAARRREIWILIVCAVMISIAQSLFYVEGRHRLAIEPLLFPVAAFGALAVRDLNRPASSRLARSDTPGEPPVGSPGTPA